MINLECDLKMGNMYDGCTSECKLEDGFVCDIYLNSTRVNVTDKNDKFALKSHIHSLPRNTT